MTVRNADSDMNPTLKSRFFDGMSLVACTVNIVTTDGTAGRAGVTVSAMSSVSADTARPTLLVCVHEKSTAADTIIENGVFCVNILRDSQSTISDVFAGRLNDRVKDKFDCTDWDTLETGAPCLSGALVSFDCTLVARQKMGTHHVFFGEVADLKFGGAGNALIYANRSYGAATPLVRESVPHAQG